MAVKVKFVFTIVLLLLVALAFFIVVNMGSFAFTGNAIFDFSSFSVHDLRKLNQIKYIVNEGGKATLVNVDGMWRRLTLKTTKDNKLIVSVDGVDAIVPVGKSNTYVFKDGKSVEIKVENVPKKGSIVVFVSGAKKRKTTVESSLDFGKAEVAGYKVQPVKVEKSFFGKLVEKLGFEKPSKRGKKLPREPKVPPKPTIEIKIDYPVYNLQVQAQERAVTTTEEEALLNLLRTRRQSMLLTTSDYGKLVIVGLCSNGRLDADIGESDVDCGGSCQPCEAYKFCNSGYDCKSSKCQVKGESEFSSPIGKVCLPGELAVCVDTSNGVEIEHDFVPNECRNERTLIQKKCLGPDVKTYEDNEIICPPGTICQSGECITDRRLCDDNDDFNDIHILGIAKDSTADRQLGRDICVNDWEVRQVNCVGGGVTYTDPQKCPDNEICSDGVCVERDICEDPDYAPEGYALLLTHGEGNIRKHLDRCLSETLVEHIVCNYYTPRFSVTDCPEGIVCNNGLCGQGERHCLEFSYGAVGKDGNSWDNHCGNSPTIRKIAKCFEDGAVDFVAEQCQEGVCFSGMCVKSTCEDSDGYNAEESGQVDAEITLIGSGLLAAYFLSFDYCKYHLWNDAPVPSNDLLYEQICEDPVTDLRGNVNSRPNSHLVECNPGQHCENIFGEYENLIGARCVDGERNFACSDSDGGNVVTILGYVETERTNERHNDWCNNQNSIDELTCNGNGYIRVNRQNCPAYDPNNLAGSYPFCYEGACVKGIDTDPDDNLHFRGYVTDIHGVIHPDFCIGNRIVELTFDVNTGALVEKKLSCPEREECKESNPGVCS